MLLIILYLTSYILSYILLAYTDDDKSYKFRKPEYHTNRDRLGLLVLSIFSPIVIVVWIIVIIKQLYKEYKPAIEKFLDRPANW